MASGAKVTNKSKSKTANARSRGGTAANGAPANRPHVATRTPVEQLTQICAQRANQARGPMQQDWFALGSYLSRFTPQTETQTQQQPSGQPLKAMSAGA